jgi:hypothetical protein
MAQKPRPPTGPQDVLVTVVAGQNRERKSSVPADVCGVCRGPVFFCQGHHAVGDGHDEAGAEPAASGPLITALRAAYLGVLLSDGRSMAPIERFGGVLLIAGHTSLAAIDVVRVPVEHLPHYQRGELLEGLRIAARVADPAIPGLDPMEPAMLAWRLLHSLPSPPDARPLAVALRRVLAPTKAHYLLQAARTTHAAALEAPYRDPLKLKASAAEPPDVRLIAVTCTSCARNLPKGGGNRLAAVREYDQAVLCPWCGVEHAHPLWPTTRRIHPVSRCYGDAAQGSSDGRAYCALHKGLPLELGLCAEGRSVYEAAVATVAGFGRRRRKRWERRLEVAIARAERRETDERDRRDALEQADSFASKINPFMERIGKALDHIISGTLGPGTPGPEARRLPRVDRK